MAPAWITDITTQWGLCTLVLTTVHAVLALATVSVMHWGVYRNATETTSDDTMGWDSITSGVLLLLAIYLQAELTRHADVMSAFQNVAQRMRAVRRLKGPMGDVSEQKLQSIREAILQESGFNIAEIQPVLTTIYTELPASDEVCMDRFEEFESSLVELKNKRAYSVPRMYQRVVYFVVITYYGIIMPAGTTRPNVLPWGTLLNVLFIAVINNVILAAGLEASSMFDRRSSSDFKRVAAMFEIAAARQEQRVFFQPY